MNNHNKTEFKSHEGNGPIDHISVNNNKNDHFEKYLDLDAIEKNRRDRRGLDQRFGGVGNENVANRKKAKDGPLRIIIEGAIGTLVFASVIFGAGAIEKKTLDEEREAANRLRIEESTIKNMHFNEEPDSITLVATSLNGKTYRYTLPRKGDMDDDQIKDALVGMMDDEIKKVAEREVFGE